MFKQMKCFVFIFVFSFYSVSTVEGFGFGTGFGLGDALGLLMGDCTPDQIIDKMKNKVSMADAVLGGISRALTSLVPPEGWECGPDDPKILDAPSHILTYNMVSWSSCSSKYHQINQCCIDHDQCCNELVEGWKEGDDKERKKPCDLIFCKCLENAADGDLMCVGVLSEFCLAMLATFDKSYQRWLDRVDRCREVDNKNLDIIKRCTPDVCNGKKCSELFEEQRGKGCKPVEIVSTISSQINEADQKQRIQCINVCEEKTGPCLDQLTECYNSCDREPKDCDDEYCKCKKNHPECLVNLMCTPREDLVHLRKVKCNKCPENEVSVQTICTECEDDEATCDNPNPTLCGHIHDICVKCECVRGMLRDKKAGKCVQKEKCT